MESAGNGATDHIVNGLFLNDVEVVPLHVLSVGVLAALEEVAAIQLCPYSQLHKQNEE